MIFGYGILFGWTIALYAFLSDISGGDAVAVMIGILTLAGTVQFVRFKRARGWHDLYELEVEKVKSRDNRIHELGNQVTKCEAQVMILEATREITPVLDELKVMTTAIQGFGEIVMLNREAAEKAASAVTQHELAAAERAKESIGIFKDLHKILQSLANRSERGRHTDPPKESQ
jgi:hypothetical protein